MKVEVKDALWCSSKHDNLKTYGLEVYFHSFLPSTLGGGEQSASRSGHYKPGGSAPGLCWIGDWVEPSALFGRGGKEKNPFLPGIETVANRCTGELFPVPPQPTASCLTAPAVRA